MNIETLKRRAIASGLPMLPVRTDLLVALIEVAEAAWTLELEPTDEDSQEVLTQTLDLLESVASANPSASTPLSSTFLSSASAPDADESSIPSRSGSADDTSRR